MSVGDSDTSPHVRASSAHRGSQNEKTCASTKFCGSSTTSKRLTDGHMATAAEVVDTKDGGLHKEEQHFDLVTIMDTNDGGIQNEEQQLEPEEREAARCELERLLATSNTDDKKNKVMQALKQLEANSSCRGTALAIIVNDTLITASATVAGTVPPCKKRQSLAGYEHMAARRTGGGIDELSRQKRFERCNFEALRPTARHDALPAGTGKYAALGGDVGSAFVAGLGTCEKLESPAQQPVNSGRRFTAQVLPSIPEHRVPGRRVAEQEESGGSEERGEKGEPGQTVRSGRIGGYNAERHHPRRRDEKEEKDGVGQKGDRGDAEPKARRTEAGLECPLTFPCREGKVVDVPSALFREATCTGVDPLHPPSAAVDGALASFWISTGLFPQTLTIRLQKPVAVQEVSIECGGVIAARIQLGYADSGARNRGSTQRSGILGGGGGDVWDARPGDVRNECSSMDPIGQQRSSAAGGGSSSSSSSRRSSSTPTKYNSSSLALTLKTMVFRAPEEGWWSEKVDRVSIVVESALAPFCLVTSVGIRGHFRRDGGEGEEGWQ